MTQERTARPTCYRCFRPIGVCYCDALTRIDNRTRIVVLQHPRETFHPLNTARIAERSLNRCEILCALPHDVERCLQGAHLSPDAAILFPDDAAEPLETLSPQRFPSEVIVLDGTWHHAKTFLRDAPCLSRYRKIRFTPACESDYRIRKEPRAEYLSTVESIAHVLSYLEPETPELEQLRAAFGVMIDRNIAQRRPEPTAARFVRSRTFRPHRFPELLGRAACEMVPLYAEGTSRFAFEATDECPSGGKKEPLMISFRLPGQAATKVVLRTQQRPPQRLLNHLALGERDLESALSPDDAREWLRTRLRPEMVLAVCNASSIKILHELGVTDHEHLELKGIYCDFQRYLTSVRKRPDFAEQAADLPGVGAASECWGGLDGVLQRHQIPLTLPEERGRGALRLAQTEALLGWIIRQRQRHLQHFA